MRLPFKLKYPNAPRDLRRDASTLVDEIIGKTLIGIAVLLVCVIVLVAEWQLPEELRFGLFESMYTSP